MTSTPPLLSYPLPLPLAQLHPDYRPGDLTGSRCSITQYAELPPYPDDCYDLVRSKLQLKPPDGPKHNHVVNALCQHLQRAGVEAHHRILRNALVYVPPPPQSSRHLHSPTDPQPNVTVRRADICIVPRHDQSVTGILGYGAREKPVMVIEVTASRPSKHDSRRVDLIDKWDDYCRAAIPEYVVLARDDVDPAVFIGTLRGACPARRQYRERGFRQDDVVQCSFFGQAGLTAAQLLQIRGGRKGKYEAGLNRVGYSLGGDSRVRRNAQVYIRPIVTGRYAGLRSRRLGYSDAWDWYGHLVEFHERGAEYNHAKQSFADEKRFFTITKILQRIAANAHY